MRKVKLSPAAQALLQCLVGGATIVEAQAVGVYCYLVDSDHRPLPDRVRYATVSMFYERGWIQVSSPPQGFPRRTEYKVTGDGEQVLEQARAAQEAMPPEQRGVGYR